MPRRPDAASSKYQNNVFNTNSIINTYIVECKFTTNYPMLLY